MQQQVGFTCKCNPKYYGKTCTFYWLPLYTECIIAGVVCIAVLTLLYAIWKRYKGPGTVYTDGGQLPGVIYEGEDDLEPLMPGNNASVNKATAKKVRRSRRSGTSKFVAPEIRLGRATQAADGLADLMGYNDMSIIQHIMATGGGVDAIINEIMWNGTAKDKQNLQELLDGTYQINDTDASPEELAARRMTLDEVMETEQVKASKLLRAHVLSIRLYSTSTHASINDCLRTNPSTKPHPLAATTYYISQGIKLLRSVAGRLPNAHEPQDFWRGMKDLTISDAFLESGGTEFACMSTSLSQAVAIDFALSKAPMILKLETKDFMSRGADISFLSVYPGESETLFPPLTFLRPIAKETFEKNGKQYLLVRCEPVIP